MGPHGCRSPCDAPDPVVQDLLQLHARGSFGWTDGVWSHTAAGQTDTASQGEPCPLSIGFLQPQRPAFQLRDQTPVVLGEMQIL